MSLDYDIGNIADRKTKFPPDEAGLMHDDLHVIIWTTMQTGMGRITEDNYVEFAERMRYAIKLNGPMYNRINADGEPVPIVFDADRIRDAIGLTTNVSTETRPQFVKRQNAIYWDNRDREIARATRAKDEATS
jgi:hypothetical protein